MLLTINGRFLTKEVAGVSRYAMEMTRALGELGSSVTVCAPLNAPDPSLPGVTLARTGNVSNGAIWEQFDLPRWLRANGEPLLISFCNTGPLTYGNHVYTLHDIAFIRHAKSYARPFRWYYRVTVPQLLTRSRRIVTVSQVSAREIAQQYRLPSSRISVIPNAVSPSLLESSFDRSALPERPYFLALNTTGDLRNAATLFEAFKLYRQQGGSARLVVAGSHNRDLDSHGAILMGRVSDTQLAQLYANAAAFISPAFYAGFNIPLIEAQSMRCKVIASDIPIHREVLGNSAIFFDALSPSQLTASLFSSENSDPELIEAGFRNARRFSWRSSAERLLEAIAVLGTTR